MAGQSQLDPVFVAVNPVTNKIYVSNNLSDNVTVIDGDTNATTSVPVGAEPAAIAINSVTNKIYVMCDPGTVVVIDGATNATTSISAGSLPFRAAVNTLTNQIYVTDFNGTNVTVIDGATNNTSTLAVGIGTIDAVADPVTNRIYITGVDTSNMTEIDGASNNISSVAIAGSVAPMNIALNPVTGSIYMSNESTSNVTVLTEQQVHPVALTTTITPIAGNFTITTAPTFTFSAASTFAPTAPPADAVYFQMDTWQGPWIRATSSGGGNFTGTTQTLPVGVHVIYAYATDGQDATSTMTTFSRRRQQPTEWRQRIAAYLFVVIPPIAPPTLSIAFNPTSIAVGATTTLTFTITNPTVNTTPLLGVAFAVGLPAGLTVVNSSATECGGTLQTMSPSTIVLTGATVAANSQCVFGVTVTGATAGNYLLVVERWQHNHFDERRHPAFPATPERCCCRAGFYFRGWHAEHNCFLSRRKLQLP